MLHVIRDGKQALAILSDGELVVGNPQVSDWFQNGVPAMRGAARGNTITERKVRIKKTDPAFHLALLDLLEELELDIDEAVQKSSAVGGGQELHLGAVPGGGGGGGASLQMELPEPPHNVHDVQGVQAYIQGTHYPRDRVVVKRDMEIYEIDAGIDWVWPIADAHGNYKDIITPDETENRAEENKANVDRLSRQLRDVPANRGETRNPKGQWDPAQRTWAGRYPPEDDSDREIKKSRRKKTPATIQGDDNG